VRCVSRRMWGAGNLTNKGKFMAQSTTYDLLIKTLGNMPRPASTHDVYLQLVKNNAYQHMEPNQAIRIISNKLCKMRDKGLIVGLVLDDNRRMMWDFTISKKMPERKPDAIEQQPIIVHTIGKPLDNTYVLHVLFLDLAAAFAKAANGLINHDK
jgi:hypothetical protein